MRSSKTEMKVKMQQMITKGPINAVDLSRFSLAPFSILILSVRASAVPFYGTTTSDLSLEQ